MAEGTPGGMEGSRSGRVVRKVRLRFPKQVRWHVAVVDPSLKADGVEPRRKAQQRMRSGAKEKPHERLDHRARSAPERQKEPKRNADFFEDEG